MKKNNEVGLLLKIFAIIGFIIIFILVAGYILIRVRSPHLLHFSKGIEEYRVKVKLDSLQGAYFIQGMKGCENLLPVKGSSDLYVSCLDGTIHHLVAGNSGKLEIIKSFKAGEAVMGLAMSRDSALYAAVCTVPVKEWFTTGGSVYRISKDLSSMERITGNFPSMNGICFDGQGNLYFASSNFNFLHPEGKVYRAKLSGGSFMAPSPYVLDGGLANGLYYDQVQDKIFFSNTLDGVYEFTSADSTLREVYLKLKFMEACDDLCTDISGNVWMTDPQQGTVKMYNPGTNRLVRFIIEGFGQASSCRIRSENGQEMLYISELKLSPQPTSTDFNGRGVLVVPAQTLLKLFQPVLIEKYQKQ